MSFVDSVFGRQRPVVEEPYTQKPTNDTKIEGVYQKPFENEPGDISALPKAEQKENSSMLKMIGAAGATAGIALSWMNHAGLMAQMMGSAMAQTVSWGGPIVLGAACCYLAYKVWKQAGVTNQNTNTTKIELHVHVLPGQNPANVICQKYTQGD